MLRVRHPPLQRSGERVSAADPAPEWTQASGDAPQGLIEAAEAAVAEEDFATALPLLDQAERLGAEADRCAGNRWLAHMMSGDFRAAWGESDAIRQRGSPDPHRFWNGEEVRGQRVIVRCLHGFGDAVQMLRFLPRLQALASHLIVEVPPRLLEIAPYFDGMGEVITWGEGAPSRPPIWDVQVEIMELPYLLRVSTADLGPTQSYLRLPSPLLAEAAVVVHSVGPARRPRVGVVWTAGEWNPSRSIAAELFRRCASLDGIEFWSLQGRMGSVGGPGQAWRDVYECGDGIGRLAAVVQHMDLVITVDTLAAHLAGALGVPCWVLLQHRADWRWMSRRVDSPWYPSLRIFRQGTPGDWAGLLEQVREELALWVA